MSGQACVLPTRMLVEDSVYSQVEERAAALAASITVGDPFDPASQMGPVINEPALERILGVVEQAASDNAGKLLAGGGRLGGPLAAGYYVAPTVFGSVDNSSSLAQDRDLRTGPQPDLVQLRRRGGRLGQRDTLWARCLRVHQRPVEGAPDCGRPRGRMDRGKRVPADAAERPLRRGEAEQLGHEGGAAGLEEFLRPKNVYVRL